MKVLDQNYKLANDVEIPKLGLGTWMIDDASVPSAVKKAIELGYRHIDTAQAYENEKGVGLGIKESGIERSKLFVTTKLAAEIKSYDEAVAAIDESLEKLGLDYIDSMIIHSPQPWAEFGKEDRFFEGNREAWRALEDAYKAGKLKSIGVSNFKVEDLQNLINNCSVKPMSNQVLAHISNTPQDIIQFCQDNDILVEAYSPIAHGELLKNDKVKEVADKYEVSVPQLSIRYDLQLGLLPLPKTANPDHMKSNSNVDFEISEEDMALLKSLEEIDNYGEASVFPVFHK